jgi:hypothetical protein
MFEWDRFDIVAEGLPIIGDGSYELTLGAAASDCRNRGAEMVAHAVCGDLAQ